MARWNELVVTAVAGLGLLLLAAPPVAAATEPMHSTMVQPERVTQAVHLDGAHWMSVDPVSGLVLVLAGSDEAEFGPRLLVLDGNGQKLAEHELRVAAAAAVEVQAFPRARRVALLVYPDGGTAESADGEAYLLELDSGKLHRLPGRPLAAAADTERGRLFLAEARGLRVLDVASGRTSALLDSARGIEQLTVSASGHVHFLQSRTGLPGSERLVTLAPPSYAPVASTDLAIAGDWHGLLAIDEAHGRVFLQHETGSGLDSMGGSSVTVHEIGRPTPARTLEGSDTAEAVLLGAAQGTQHLYLHDATSGLLRIYEAESLQQVQRVQDFRGNLLGFDVGGNVLAASGALVQRRDPRTFAVLDSLQLDGYVNLAALDPVTQRVFLIVESWTHGHWSERLVRLDLESFSVLP